MENKMSENYSLTRASAYMSFFNQAAVITLIPLLFIPIREDLDLSYLSLATLVSINFIVQLITDLSLSRIADKYGFKPFLLLSEALIFLGFILFSLSPDIFSNPYQGFVIGTVFFSIGGGLGEILISPLINSLPTKSKRGSMAFLHSVYGIGQMFVIIITSFSIHLAGSRHWRIIVACWAFMPLINFFMYLKARFPKSSRENIKATKIGQDLLKPQFILCMLIIFFGAGVENTMVQWSSAYMEKAMSLPKLFGDSLGIFMFALMLSLCRLMFGIRGNKINLPRAMLIFSVCSVFCYAAITLTSFPAVALTACAFTGFFSAMLWPGSLLLANESLHISGAWLFAFLAFSGDCGAAFCPWLSGLLSDKADKIPVLARIAESSEITNEQLGMRSGMALSVLYPLLTALFIYLYIRLGKKSKELFP